MDKTKYGARYWCVKVPISLSPDGEIYVYADRVDLVSGALVFVSDAIVTHNGPDTVAQPGLSIAAGSWIAVFAASVIDGSAVAVEHWKDEVAE
jgi:hypothetical protein